MKRLKIYCSVLLVLSILLSGFVGAFAASVSYLHNPLYGVNGRIYYSTPYGFIIQCGEETGFASALVDPYGVKIPPVKNRNFGSDMTRSGYLSFCQNDDYGNFVSCGIIHANGTIVFQTSQYTSAVYLKDNRYLCTNKDYQQGIVDGMGNIIVPFGLYNWMNTQPDKPLIFVYDVQYNCGLIDSDGNVILQFGQVKDIDTLYSVESYIKRDYNTDVTYVYDKYGNQTATINGRGYPYPFGLIDVTVRDEVNNTANAYIYDVNGNLTQTLSYTNDSMPYRWDSELYTNPKTYTTKYDYENKAVHVINSVTGDWKCSLPTDGYYVDEIYNCGLIKYETAPEWKCGLMDFNGNSIVPPSADSIEYSADFDVFAYSINNTIYMFKCENPIGVSIDGIDINFDQEPIIKDGRTLVPLRAIFEALGASVNWDDITKTVTSVLGDKEVKLTIGSNAMYVNGTAVTLDTVAEIIGGRTLVPVRAISEAFGCLVNWDAGTRKVLISK